MNERTLRVLEYPKVLERLAAHTSFSLGRELVTGLKPTTDVAEAQQWQDTTGEARELIENRPEVTIGAARDVRQPVRIAALGRALDPGSFLELLGTLVSSRNLRRIILKEGQNTNLFYLGKLAERLVDLPLLEGSIESTIGPDGTVLDSASSHLRSIRNEIRTAHGRLLERLNSILSSAQYRPVIQEAIITMREGRYVVPVKADFKGQLRGIVHDQSASGATVYIEPLVIVELNNRWKKLQLDEKDEIERVLRELSNQVGRHADEIVNAIEAIGEIDLHFAKAKYAAALRCNQPKLTTPGVEGDPTNRQLNFIQARHPLLTGKVVPIDLYFGGEARVLVITGPNTGGKTVSIKTAGLLTLMAMSGLHLPTEEGSQAVVFEQIFADIGDEQSIEQSLSTFSSHMTNIINMLDRIDRRTFVIMDELGAGTDPTEGAALARSIIEFILSKQAVGIITTHYSELKSFAYVTEGVQNASVEFDVESLSPTYRLSIGLPGRSNALAIASRLGLRQDIIETARNFVGAEDIQVDEVLAQIQHDREETSRTRYETSVLKAQVEKQKADLARQLRGIDETRKQAVKEARAEARAELEAELASVRDESQKLRQRLLDIEFAAKRASESSQIAAELEKQRKAVAEAERAAQNLQREARRRASTNRTIASLVPEEVETPPKVGDRVMIESLQQEGNVISEPDGDGRYEVQFGSFKVRVLQSDLHRLSGKSAPDRKPQTARERRDAEAAREKESSIRVNVRSRSEVADTSFELDMRGWRAEEVARELDRYLNDAYLANLPFVRLVHGKGTGVLRQVVRDFLKTNPLVKSFRNGEQTEGGDGVTVVTLKG